ncbi:MAG TPA: hypothetical protein VHW23_03380 [Kofleriaceae bacterium]|jgi:hypothetical protein|nr:hypothetical protein [Kofleriaceae bacterium]
MRITLLGLVFLVACGNSNRSTSDASSPGDGATGDGSPGGGSACGGLGGRACSATEYCDYADNDCGVGDRTGTCRSRPDVCPVNAGATPAIVAMPTCACDGKLYDNDCDAARAGFDLNAHGTCDIAAGHFACGDTQCILATQYCRRQPHTTGPDTFSCAPLPAACASTQGCGCLQSQPCGNSCTGTAAAGLTLSCPPTP